MKGGKKFQKSKSLKTYLGHFLLQKLSQNSDFCTCPRHNVVKRDASVKKGQLLCCERIFDRIKANLAEIQPKNHQNVQKTHFFAKSSSSQWFKNQNIYYNKNVLWKLLKVIIYICVVSRQNPPFERFAHKDAACKTEAFLHMLFLEDGVQTDQKKLQNDAFHVKTSRSAKN